MKYWIVAAHVSLAVPAIAMDARHPDWPCPQIVVPKLSAAAFWTGPSIDDVGDAWTKDQTVHDLVLSLAGRRDSSSRSRKRSYRIYCWNGRRKTTEGETLVRRPFRYAQSGA